MSVSGHRQSKVTFITRGVTRALHRTQHQVRDHPLLRGARDLFCQMLKAALRNGSMHRELVSEGRGDLCELLDLQNVWFFVNAIENRHSERIEVSRNRFVRQKHELFNQTVSDVSFRPDDSSDLPFIVEQKLG